MQLYNDEQPVSKQEEVELKQPSQLAFSKAAPEAFDGGCELNVSN